jgi:hypothetical protein
VGEGWERGGESSRRGWMDGWREQMGRGRDGNSREEGEERREGGYSEKREDEREAEGRGFGVRRADWVFYRLLGGQGRDGVMGR